MLSSSSRSPWALRCQDTRPSFSFAGRRSTVSEKQKKPSAINSRRAAPSLLDPLLASFFRPAAEKGAFRQGRSSGSPAFPAAFPFRCIGTVATRGRKGSPAGTAAGAGLQRRDRSRFSRDSLLSPLGTLIFKYYSIFLLSTLKMRFRFEGNHSPHQWAPRRMAVPAVAWRQPCVSAEVIEDSSFRHGARLSLSWSAFAPRRNGRCRRRRSPGRAIPRRRKSAAENNAAHRR